MAKLGIVSDASRSSDATFDKLLQQSKYPIILSYSSLKLTNDNPHNLDE
jgi:microsomal dipeptidase-like Zn-dependent dipeptidase